jgi:predicted enzyme related to lactoylglutathione lyase
MRSRSKTLLLFSGPGSLSDGFPAGVPFETDRAFGGGDDARILTPSRIFSGEEESVLQGLRTAIYNVDDLERAKGWYGEVLGKEPYFDEPFYVGFDVGGFELGLQPDEGGSTQSSTGVVAYWGVEDAEAALARLLDLGATGRSGVQDVGEGIRIATVLDPSGNVFGIIENPHFSLEGA